MQGLVHLMIFNLIIYRYVFSTDLKDKELKYWTKSPNKFIVAKSKESGKILGCASYKKISPTTVSLHRVAVDRDFRGLKIGENLLVSLIDMAKENGCNTINSDTTEAQKAAQGLYKKLGFKYLNNVPNEPQVFGINFEHLGGIKELAFEKKL